MPDVSENPEVVAFLNFVCGDEIGMTAPEEWASLEDADISAAAPLLPKAKRKKFTEAVAKIQQASGSGNAAAEAATPPPPSRSPVQVTVALLAHEIPCRAPGTSHAPCFVPA